MVAAKFYCICDVRDTTFYSPFPLLLKDIINFGFPLRARKNALYRKAVFAYIE